MDTERIRTFLEIARWGSFVDAAAHLNVTQTTVSARIKSLEDELRCRLFIRNRNGARLTPSGIEFRPYAESFIQVWERGRQQVAVPAGRSGFVAVGGELSLWNPLMLNWMIHMRRSNPQIALRGNVSLPDQLMENLRTGTLDIAVMYAPPYDTGLVVDRLFQETLVLVTASGSSTFRVDGEAPANYVYVDWGPQFSQQHAARFPRWSEAAVHIDLGPLGLNFVMATRGCGYFRLGVVRPHLASGALAVVEGAPPFEYPAYAVYARNNGNSALSPALQILHDCAQEAEGVSG